VVAAHLGLSRRTLDRRLAAEGTSFHALLDSVRREIAWRQLHESRRSLTDIAGLLGFQGLPAFSAWFRAGFGLSPRAARLAGRDGVPGLLRG
jgi:AraC-like DNA-binding protein